MKKKILFVAGARPNFMKIAPVLRELNHNYVERVESILVHTGQHYDEQMSGSFFGTLGIREPNYNLGVGSGSHAKQTAKIMVDFEKICESVKPDFVVVVGDVNSTVAAALVSKKLQILLVHIEAGLRSGDRTMPEEINRLVTDSITDIFFVTEESGIRNLLIEGHDQSNIHFVGHVMIDNLFYQLGELNKIGPSSKVLEIRKKLGSKYACLTMHRPSNVDNVEILGRLVSTFERVSKEIQIVFPCHPRTRQNLEKYGFFNRICNLLIVTEPLGYNDFLALWKDSAFVLTDSGGMQEETTALQVPCITLRENTERPITVDVGSNTLVGSDEEKIIYTVKTVLRGAYKKGGVPNLWDGKASKRLSRVLCA